MKFWNISERASVGLVGKLSWLKYLSWWGIDQKLHIWFYLMS